MYAELLRGLFAAENITTEESQAAYLRALQPHVRGLRQAYKRYPVGLDYTDRRIQAAYLLAYAPHYTEPLYEILRRTGGIAPARLSLFGTGPCPELVGMLRYMQDYHPQNAEKLHVTAYDIAHDGWAWSRNIVLNNVVPLYRGLRQCNVDSQQLDFSKPFTIPTHSMEFCVFQNCLNEIHPDVWDTFSHSVTAMFKSLPPGSWLCIIHAGENPYSRVRVIDLMRQIEKEVAVANPNRIVARGVSEEFIPHRSKFGRPPPQITRHLLTARPGGTNEDTLLLPKRKLPFRYSLIGRV